MAENRHLPLNGIRVLEFSHVVLGPVCGLVLADLGAEVIKVERPPDGDDTRRLGGFGSGFFACFNRNKKSLAVDIKSDQGRDIVYKLIKTADVLIENFAPGTMDRLGLSYQATSRLNPALIYCSLKGFLNGPYEHRPALDEAVQMMSGLAYMTGPPGQPLRAGASIIDIMCGTYGAIGILIALKERGETGRGQLVRSALFETAAFVMGHHLASSALSQEPVLPMPARVSSWSIYRIFKTRDGEPVFVGITSDKHWQRFCHAFEQETLFADERLRTNHDRLAARDWLLPILEKMFGSISKTEVLQRCEAAGIPFAPVAQPEDLLNDPHLNANDSLLVATLPDGSQMRLPRLPVIVGQHERGIRLHSPKVGEHTQPLLTEIGYSDEELSTLSVTEVIRS